MKSKPETIDCKLINNELIFRCRYCKTEHHHSLPEGIKTSICREFGGSPYLRYGYTLLIKKSEGSNHLDVNPSPQIKEKEQ